MLMISKRCGWFCAETFAGRGKHRRFHSLRHTAWCCVCHNRSRRTKRVLTKQLTSTAPSLAENMPQ
jgi:hypothetical protein